MRAPRKDEGAVLLTTLLIMSFMASLAVTISGDVRFAVRRTVAVEDTLQAANYLSGAESYALAYVRDNFAELEDPAFNALLLAGQSATLPIPGGAITLSLSDGSNCLNPAGVVGGEPVEDSADGRTAPQNRLINLMTLRGIPNFEAQSLVFALVDWQDPDNNVSPGGAEDAHYMLGTPAYRSADTPITTVSEMRAVRGMTAERFAAIAPWMCVTDTGPATLNVNTLTPAHAPLLAASLGDFQTETTALDLLSRRPPEGWTGGEEGTLKEALSGIGVGDIPDNVGTAPSALRVDLAVTFRGSTRRARLYTTVDGTLLSRERGDAIGPTVEDLEENLGRGGRR